MVVDWGGQSLRNLGDLAMLLVAVRRLEQQFPGARIHVATHTPDAFLRFCPNAHPLLEDALQALYWRRLVPGRIQAACPFLERLEDAALRRWPLTVLSGRIRRCLRDGDLAAKTRAALEVLREADLVVAAGGGYLNDVFPGHARRVLGLLETALHLGKPVALFGQGIGPLRDPLLRGLTGTVLRRACLIALREDRHGPALLRDLGVEKERLYLTGDDALAWVESSPGPESAWEGAGRIGWNVRLARYSGDGSPPWREVACRVAAFARAHGTRLLPCPVDIGHPDGDDTSARAVLEDSDLLDDLAPPATHEELVRRIGRCRIMVTASYHAAVFALGQGIPTLCLARTEYYRGKFQGLVNAFGDLCLLVGWEGSDPLPDIMPLLERMGATGHEDRERARGITANLVASSRAAYDALATRIGGNG